MSAEHLILAGAFAVLFVGPLAWLFLSDRAPRPTEPRGGDAAAALPTAPAAAQAVQD